MCAYIYIYIYICTLHGMCLPIRPLHFLIGIKLTYPLSVAGDADFCYCAFHAEVDGRFHLFCALHYDFDVLCLCVCEYVRHELLARVCHAHGTRYPEAMSEGVWDEGLAQ